MVFFDLCFRGCEKFQCNSQGRPTSLALGRAIPDLTDEGGFYVNSLTPAIGSLAALTSLEIALPTIVWVSELARLTNLQTLIISEPLNFPNGSIIPFPGTPMTLPTFLGALSGVTRLSVTSRSLVALPTEIGLLPSLTSLEISCPNLTSIPSELGLLSNLTTIRLAMRAGQLPRAFEGKRFFGFDAVNANLSGQLPLFVYDGPADGCQLRGNKFDTTTSLCPFGCQCDRTVVLQPPLTLPTPPTTELTTVASTTLAFVAPDELSDALANLTTTFGIALGVVGAVMLIGFIAMCIVIVKLRARLASGRGEHGNVEQRAASAAPSPYSTLPHQSNHQHAQPAHYNNANIEFSSTRSDRQQGPPTFAGTQYTDIGRPAAPASGGYYTGDQGFASFQQQQHNFQ